jgi:hypothetical protein
MDASQNLTRPGPTARTGSVARGLIAALTATLVVSLLMLLKQALGFMPNVNLVMELANALGYHSAIAGWTAHLIIGVLAWGLLFSWLDRYMRFAHWVNGLFFASVVWLGVMLIVLPAAGRGLFGVRGLELGTPTVTLLLHWIYGFVLGSVYGLLQPGRRNA